MGKLLEIYDTEIGPDIQIKLGQAKSLADAGGLIREALEKLLHPQGNFLGDMPPPQRDVARQMLDQVYQSAKLLQTALCTTVVSVPTGHGSSNINDMASPAVAGVLTALAA